MNFPISKCNLLRFFAILLIFLSIAAVICPLSASADNIPKKQLLVLHSYHKGYKWTDDITLGIELALKAKGQPVRIHYEYMDTKRVSSPDFFALLFDAYRFKFKNMKFDAIIVSDNDALEFILTYRKTLFPSVPVIFCGINNFTPEQLHGAKRVTGVNESADILETFELALKLHPSAKRIVVINDTTTTGRIIHNEIERIIPLFDGRIKFEFLEDTTVPEIQSALQKLGSDAIVFFTLFSRDKNGTFIEYDETISHISQTCPAPIYGVWDFYLGLGVVGGKLTSGFSQGEAAGQLASRVLSGENIDQIPVVIKSPNQYMFDYRQMQMFGIALGDIPKDSIIINRPASLYTVSRNVFWGIISALIISVLIILILLYNTVRRIRAEERSKRLAAIVDSSDDAIIGKTLDGVITSWNKGAEKIFGYSEQEVIGKPVSMLVPHSHRESTRSVHDMIRRGEHLEHFETVRMKKTGELLHMSLTYSPVSDNHGKVVAVSTIGRDITEKKRGEELQLENALINRELEIAQQIQQSFLPACPETLPGMHMSCICEPAAHVGGDYYDLFTLEDGVIDVVIADITGHSVGSALLMTETRSVLQAKANNSTTPGKILSELNNLLMSDLTKTEMQMSMFYARIDTNHHRITYANAGHCRPLLFSSKQQLVRELDAEGMLIGVMPNVVYEEIDIPIGNDDMLFMYTDGIIEAESSDGEMFGTKRLSALLAEYCSLQPREVVSNALSRLTEFTGTETRDDDVALVVIKFQ